MRTEVYLRYDIENVLAGLWGTIDTRCPYDQGRRAMLLAVARSFGITPEFFELLDGQPTLTVLPPEQAPARHIWILEADHARLETR